MKVVIFPHAVEYYLQTESFLLQQEATNCFILALGKSLLDATPDVNSLPYFAAIAELNSVVASAIYAPPRKLVISDTNSSQAVKLLAESMAKYQQVLPGITAPQTAAEIFTARWQSLTGQCCQQKTAMEVYQLETIRSVVCSKGTIELAEQQDRYLLTNWIQAFVAEALGKSESRLNSELWVDRHLQQHSLYVWKDNDAIVSMAAYGSETPNGIRIKSVYTPPQYRGKGYATSLVALMSQKLLKTYMYCFLFTDVSNLVSNRIYRKIGYEPMSRFSDYDYDS